MKQLNATTTSLLLGLGLLLGATSAKADPSVQTTTPQVPTQLAGSDTLEDIVNKVLDDSGIRAGSGITAYAGIGSSGGQRQMMGAPSTGEPTCTAGAAVNGDSNWGCQEVAPMSRQMNSAICTHDADDPRDADDSTTANSTAEGLAVCLDGIALITDNAGHRQYADSAAACVTPSGDPVWGPAGSNPPIPNGTYAGTGKLRQSGTLPSGYVIQDWKDVLRLVYTGCKNTDGTCANTLTRLNRCSAATNPVRAEIVNNWNLLFESGAVAGDSAVDCPEGNHCSQLRAAFRRDDASGTTTFFLEALGLRSGSADLAARSRMAVLGGAGTTGFQAVPENIFCDGGQFEGIWPAPYASGGTPVIGDPLHRPCSREDDLCGPDKTVGLVRAIRSPKDGAYPTVQCSRNNFAYAPFPATNTVPTCPDGTPPTALGCLAPYYLSGGVKNFDCLNDANSLPTIRPAALTDGRVFNFVWRKADGTLQPGNTAALPEVAQWRQNMATLNIGIGASAGGPFGVAPVGSNQTYDADPAQASFTKSYAATAGKVCQNTAATSLIGCLVGSTRCTLGFAGREVVDNDAALDTHQEPVRVAGQLPTDTGIITGSYAIARSLYINALGGFENIAADCAARGASAEYCADEVLFAKEFYNMSAGSNAANACTAFGFLPILDPSEACVTNADCGLEGTTCVAGACTGATHDSMQTKWNERCTGTVGAAGCGRATVQDNARCNPDLGGPEGLMSAPACTPNVSPNSGANDTCG